MCVCVCVYVCVGFQSDVSGCGGFYTCVLCVYVCARAHAGIQSNVGVGGCESFSLKGCRFISPVACLQYYLENY